MTAFKVEKDEAAQRVCEKLEEWVRAQPTCWPSGFSEPADGLFRRLDDWREAE